MKTRVVITGLGAITPLGNDVKSFWDGIVAGKNGIDKIMSFDTTNFKVKLAGEVKNFDPTTRMEAMESKRQDRFSQFAVCSALEAKEDAGLTDENHDANLFGCIVSSGIGGFSTTQNQLMDLANRDWNWSRTKPMYIPMMIPNMASGNAAIAIKAKGFNTSVVTACASGTHSIGDAFKVIQRGDAKVMVAGGTEAAICEIGIAGFQALTAMSTSEDKDRASIPFDKERNGFIMGEGAGVLVLEDLEHAKARGAKIYAEIVGYGATCDAYHQTAPSGEGAARAMEMALRDAGIAKEEVSYINAHGTSTPINDKFETKAILDVFGDVAKNIPVSSTKSMTGHLLGAAGGIEAVISVLSLRDGIIPATINHKVCDEDCSLDYVTEGSRKADLKYVMSNSLGFGGHNGVLLFKKWEG